MVDLANYDKALEPAPSGPSNISGEVDVTSKRMGPPRTDTGTILLHWTTAIAMVISLATGLRIMADDPAWPIAKWMSSILPQGEVWSWHFITSLVLFFASTAYLVYLARTGLARRNMLSKLNVLTMPRISAKLRWGAVNILLHWAMYVAVVIMTATGIAMYLGYGNWVVTVHALAALFVLSYFFIHLLAHYFYGGWQQLLRLFRPAALSPTERTKRWPFAVALAVGVPVAYGVYALDIFGRDTLIIQRVTTLPKLTGDMSDPVWHTVRPVYVQTSQGANLGGTGESLVEIRAVHDGENITFAFRWEDPTLSLRRLPLIKKEDGWHLMNNAAAEADETMFYEDKFAALIGDHDGFGDGGVAHFGPQPRPDLPAPLNGRGLHYTTDGSVFEMWQMKPSRGSLLLGQVDHMYIGPPTPPSKDDWDQKTRYQAGYWGVPGTQPYYYNYVVEPPGGLRGVVVVKRLPKDYRATMAALGKFDWNPDSSDDPNARWYMLEEDTVPYSKEADAEIPVGTVIPGNVINNRFTGERGDLSAAASWSNGHWTLEVTRKLVRGPGKWGHDFLPGKELFMWVAVFDHTQTRHTRHQRPVRLLVHS